jgi:hypothetical protein
VLAKLPVGVREGIEAIREQGIMSLEKFEEISDERGMNGLSRQVMKHLLFGEKPQVKAEQAQADLRSAFLDDLEKNFLKATTPKSDIQSLLESLRGLVGSGGGDIGSLGNALKKAGAKQFDGRDGMKNFFTEMESRAEQDSDIKTGFVDADSNEMPPELKAVLDSIAGSGGYKVFSLGGTGNGEKMPSILKDFLAKANPELGEALDKAEAGEASNS